MALDALGVNAPLRVAKRVVEMVQRRTQNGAIERELKRNEALEIIEQALEPLAGVALEHAGGP